MKNTAMKKQLLGLCFSAFAASALANTGDDVYHVQTQWAVANYELSGDDQEKAFTTLVEEVENLTKANPKSADLWIWSGIVKSSFAGVKGGLGALSLAKQSRADLERALQLDAGALQGSAYTSLGALYSKVPGWPVAFGSGKKARELFAKALKINPQGIDSNYFYAEFMYDEGEYREAEKHYLLAQRAAPRPDRPLADAGRQKEISAGLEKVRKKLDH